MKGNLINKELFLTALTCPTMAWHEIHLTTPKPMSTYDKFMAFAIQAISTSLLTVYSSTRFYDPGRKYAMPLIPFEADDYSSIQRALELTGRFYSEELKGATIDDVLSGKVQIPIERDYGESIAALVKKFPKLKTELWGALPR